MGKTKGSSPDNTEIDPVEDKMNILMPYSPVHYINASLL